MMYRRRIVIETPDPIGFVQKIRDLYTLARIGVGALRVRNFIRTRPVTSTLLGLGTGFVLARAFGPRR
jgi:hypothetical protein